jgi:hypothetical protein
MSKRCGLHYYPVKFTLPAQTQITGRKNNGIITEELQNQVYVSQKYTTAGFNDSDARLFCRIFCQGDILCISFTVFGPNFDAEGKNTCVLNYGPSGQNKYRELGIPLPNGTFATGFATAPKHCPTTTTTTTSSATITTTAG